MGDDGSREELELRRVELLRQAELLEIHGTALEDLPPFEVERAREALRDGIVASVRAVDGAETEEERERYLQNAQRGEEALASISPPPSNAGLVAAEHRLEASEIAAQLAEDEDAPESPASRSEAPGRDGGVPVQE